MRDNGHTGRAESGPPYSNFAQMERNDLPTCGLALALDGDELPAPERIAALQRPRQPVVRAHAAHVAIRPQHVNAGDLLIRPVDLPVGDIRARGGGEHQKFSSGSGLSYGEMNGETVASSPACARTGDQASAAAMAASNMPNSATIVRFIYFTR